MEPVGFFKTPTPDNTMILVFLSQMPRDEPGEIPSPPIHLASEFEAYCGERGLPVTLEFSRLTGSYTGQVYFNTENERFEFKMRWGV